MNVQDADTVGVRILDAALQLLRSPGPPAVTMQSVTEATGIAKTTLYRRHRNRRALLAAALEQLAPTCHRPAGKPRAAATLGHRAVDRRSRERNRAGGFAALLTNEDPDFSEVFRAIVATYPANQQSPSWIATKVTAISLSPSLIRRSATPGPAASMTPAAVALEGR